MKELFTDPSDKIAAFAALLGVLSLIVSIYSAQATKKYAKEQIELARQQFLISNVPDIEIKVFLQRKKPATYDFTLGLFLEVTNHSNTIAINHLKVFLTGEAFGDFIGCGFIFPTFSDLKPGQNLKVEALQDCEKVITGSFPSGTIDYYYIDDKDSLFMNNNEYEKYPATLSTEYLPRTTGASVIKKQEEKYLIVKRKYLKSEIGGG